MALYVLLGFSAGLPFLLVFSTLNARLADVGVETATIGFFSWLGITYSIKVFWAPVVDRLKLPLLDRLLALLCGAGQAPSPAAAATRLVEPARKSPTAKMPSTLVSSVRAPCSGRVSAPVSTKPLSSSATPQANPPASSSSAPPTVCRHSHPRSTTPSYARHC